MSDALPYPGSDEARAGGCCCPVLDNAHGRRPPRWKWWVIAEGCPIHPFPGPKDQST